MLTLARAAVLTLGLLLPTQARSQPPPARRCQQAIEAAGRELLGHSLAALAACRRGVAAGSLAAGVECTAEPTTAQKRGDAAARAAARLQDDCTDDQVASLALGGDCAEARTVAALVRCLLGSHGAEAEAVSAVVDGAQAVLSARARRCATQTSRQARRFALARLQLLVRCKRSSRAELLAPGADCTAEPRTAARIAKRRARALLGIATACDAATLAATPFGAPCDRTAGGDELAQCVAAAVEAAVDGAVAAESRDRAFCGDGADTVEGRIDTLLASMTLTEKIDLMHGSTFAGTWRTGANAALGIPGFGMIDGPRGVSAGTGHATAFPVGMARGATWDAALEERVGEAIGAEARAKGGSVILAPTINMLRHPRWGRAQETYSEDTFHLGSMAVGFVRGAQQHVIANPKHFAGNSIENTRFSVNVSIDERTLREVYLPHFRRAVQQGHAASVMSAYNLVNGQYCAENVHQLHDVLKGDWGFQGFVESDWILGTRSTVPSALAGLDIEMPSGVYYGQPLVDAATGGQVPADVIDGAVRRILRAQLCFRLDSDPPVVDPSLVETPEHLALALEVARKGLVLLKNDQAALPLDRAQVGSIVVVGALAATANLGDTGSSNVNPTSAVAPLAGIMTAAGGVTVTHVPGPTLSPGDEAAIAAAGAAVVIAGLTPADEGEGLITHGDRDSLAMPGTQDALIAAVAALNPRTVVVLEGSGPIVMPWAGAVPAILMAWYPGQEGGTAIAETLFGDVNPSGKLPLTFPVAEADLPPFDNVTLAVTYDYYHGYRHLDRLGTPALFPFGFGLSYTTFQYANLRIAPATLEAGGRLRATVDVTNTGAVAGDEVVQLYVSYTGSVVDRAVKDLKAFARVHLEPGETRTVPLLVRAADLAYWDVGSAGWVVEPITYGVHVGPSSQELPLSGSFTVAP